MNENTKWFSQTVLTYKDKQYSTDGYLRISISSNTEDYKFFNPPLFNISISNSNNFQKSCNLNIQNAEDLIESFEKSKQQQNGNEDIIEKHYNKLSKIYFKFTIDNNSQMRVVVIEIYSNESDATKVVVPLKPTFQSFLKRLRFFVANYDILCLNLLTQSINNESIQIIQQLPNLIKGIASQIVPQNPTEDLTFTSNISLPTPEDVSQTETINYDFEKFLGKEMENISIPEITEELIERKQEEIMVEVDSPFINKVLKNDLENIENKINTFVVSKNSFLDLVNDLQIHLNFDVIAGITEDDKKSICYLSKLLNEYYLKEYTLNQTVIPDKTITLKFSGNIVDENVSLAKDLLTIIGYMRILKRRLENKFTNPYDSKSLIYIYIRHLLDPLCFSFLQKFTNTEITASLLNRFKYFSKIGFFTKYEKLLENSNCSPITLQDIESFANEVYDSMVKSPFVGKLHDMLHSKGNVKLPSKNTFNLEQITNEFVIVELSEKIGVDIKDPGVLNKFKDDGISDEILKIFSKSKQLKKTNDLKIKKVTSLEKVVEKFQQDIPEEYRKDVFSYVSTLKDSKFNFDTCDWPLMEFDSRIVVAFYVWDPENNPEMKNNFNYFMSLVENEQITKEDVIILKQKTNEKKSSFDFENINFE